MSRIHLTQDHGLGVDQARSRIDRIAARLEHELQVACQWHGNQLHFQRPGARGTIDVAEEVVTLDVQLGLLLTPMRQMIAARLADKLSTVLA